MVAHFNGNPKATITVCYSPTNVSEQSEIGTFYEQLASSTRQIAKHNVHITTGDFNAHLGRLEGFLFSYHELSNRNGELLNDYLKENRQICLNTKFQKRKGQLWTHNSPNDFKAQLDYILINKKWKNSVKNCRAYNSFVSIASDHRIVTANIQLTLRSSQKKKKEKSIHYDWSLLNSNTNLRKSFTNKVTENFKNSTKNDTQFLANIAYNHFETACRETAKELIPEKPKKSQYKPWENEDIYEKRKLLKQAAAIKDGNPTQENINYYKLTQKILFDAYDCEQSKYLQNRIDEITSTVTNKKSATAWKTINEISGRKSTNKAKIKATDNQDRIQKWQDHFKELLGNQPDISDHDITPIFTELQDIQTGLFSMTELIKALKNMKNGKSCGLDEIPVEIWKIESFQELLLNFCNSVYAQDKIDKWRMGCIIPFPKKGNLSSTKNYRGITLTCISAKIYNLMFLNRIRPVLDPLLRKNQNGFRQNRSTTGQILTIRRIIEGAKSKQLPATLLFIDFSKAFDSIHRGKMREILTAYGLPEEIVKAIMISYINTKCKVRSPDGDTDYFDITAGVLQGDTLAPFLFIVCLDYVLRKSMNINLGFTLEVKKSRRHPAIKITDIDYADDLAVVTDNIKDANTLLNKLEEVSKEIGLNINTAKTEYMTLNIDNTDNTNKIKSLNGNEINKVNDFKYLGSYISSTEKDLDIRLAKSWSALNAMNKIWKSNLKDKLKRNLFRATVESVLVYGSTTWTMTKAMEKRLDGNYTRMLRAALNIMGITPDK